MHLSLKLYNEKSNYTHTLLNSFPSSALPHTQKLYIPYNHIFIYIYNRNPNRKIKFIYTHIHTSLPPTPLKSNSIPIQHCPLRRPSYIPINTLIAASAFHTIIHNMPNKKNHRFLLSRFLKKKKISTRVISESNAASVANNARRRIPLSPLALPYTRARTVREEYRKAAAIYRGIREREKERERERERERDSRIANVALSVCAERNGARRQIGRAHV